MMNKQKAFKVVRVLRCSIFLALFSAFLFVPRLAQAEVVEVNGIVFPGSYFSGEKKLQIRGAAMLRWAMMVDLYAGAFYLPEDVPSEDWYQNVAKHLELSYFREIPAAGFVESSQEHLEATLLPAELKKIKPRLQKLYALFRDVKAGDRYTLAFDPDVGTTLSLNGEELGVIPGADFAKAYFGIWLGEEPLNKKFRNRVLGISSS